jgi:hypothetical protein
MDMTYVFAILGFALVLYLMGSLRVLRQYERGVVFLLGKFKGVRGPGRTVPGYHRAHGGDLGRRPPVSWRARKALCQWGAASVTVRSCMLRTVPKASIGPPRSR